MNFTPTNLKTESNYHEFGKFALQRKLLKQGILLVKYKNSYAVVPKLKRTNVSKDFVDEITYIFDTGKIDYEKLRELSNQENELFKSLITRSGLYDTLDYDYSKTRDNVNDIIEQYDILKGEIEADNNNPELIAKVKIVLKKLYHHGQIKKDEYDDIVKGL